MAMAQSLLSIRLDNPQAGPDRSDSSDAGGNGDANQQGHGPN
jgi:hypothetical protein